MDKYTRKSFRHAAVLVLPVILAAVSLAGCQETPEVEIVKQKKTVEEAETLAADSKDTIADQVQAPDHYKASFKDTTGYIEVEADADIVIPDAEGFTLKKVEPRDFNQADVDAVVKTFAKGAPLWRRIYPENDPTGGMTKSELESILIQLKKNPESMYYQKYGETPEEAIEKVEEFYAAAPDTYETEMAESKIGVLEGHMDAALDQVMGIDASFNADGDVYWISMINNRSEDWKWIMFNMMNLSSSGNYWPVNLTDLTDADKGKLRTPIEDIEKMGDSVVAQLGFDEMVRTGGEYAVDVSYEEGAADEAGDAVSSKIAYVLHYTRNVDGIPITYTSENGGTSEHDEGQADYSPAWPYESLELYYDDTGLLEFAWGDPYVVTDLSNENVYLMPFSEIQGILEEMMEAKYADMAKNKTRTTFHINEVRLGYMRIKEKNNSDVGTLVPVWDFFGSQTCKQEGDRELIDPEWTMAGKYDCWLTINAMDGSIIDRGMGY